LVSIAFLVLVDIEENFPPQIDAAADCCGDRESRAEHSLLGSTLAEELGQAALGGLVIVAGVGHRTGLADF